MNWSIIFVFCLAAAAGTGLGLAIGYVRWGTREPTVVYRKPPTMVQVPAPDEPNVARELLGAIDRAVKRAR